MKAQYAHMTARIVKRVKETAATATTYDLRFLYLGVYPMIARAMWAGDSQIIVSSVRLADAMRQKLRDDGYFVGPNPVSALTQIISWGVHKIPSVGDEAERVVPSWEYEAYLIEMDERFDREREAYDLHS